MLLEVKNLSKSFGKTEAVKNISFSADEGRIIGLIGPNGAGKSTIINMLSGILNPDSGSVLFNGMSVLKNLKEWKRRTGIVLEELALFDYLSVRDNIIFTGRLYGLEHTEALKRAEELLAFFDLNDKQNTLIAESSHGMKKKTAFALSLIHNPEILFLDEAFTGIDAVTIRKIKELLNSLTKKGRLIFLSSHILDSIDPLIEECIIIKNGTIVYSSEISEIRRQGKTLENVYTEIITERNFPETDLSWL
jgi:ABC-2 type transport system ATP-binding protein